MKKIITAGFLMLALAHSLTPRGGLSGRIVLPNPRLLRCASSNCFQVWSEKSIEENAVFPKQLIIDMDQSCLYGMTALYDKILSVDDVKMAIDGQYKKWAQADVASPSVKLWRVESEKFSIQLSIAGKEDEKKNIAEQGTKQAIYIAFGGKAACKIS